MSSTRELPLVSTVIPTWKRSHLVCRSVRSALNQSYSELEVVVVINGEDAATTRVLEEICDPRLRTITLMKNVGPGEGRNTGVRESRGEWISFLDDDDEWQPDKIEKQIASTFNAANDVNFVCCRFEERRPDGARVLPHDFPRPDEHWSDYLYCRGGLLFPSTFLVTRSLMLAMPFSSTLSKNEDFDWLLRVKAAGLIRPVWLNAALTIYHDETEANRLSNYSEWRERYQWMVDNSSVLTKSAIPYYIGRMCIQEAKHSDKPRRACAFLLKEAMLRGRIGLRSLAYLFTITLTGRSFRRKLLIALGFRRGGYL